ncbi:hypothetical protein C0585_06340 [Candidatus Woesearchaeota archaeon]|nr:MAG: hypothetical protein C0585_06340 [Candidatus Woesearchaeota archaeon]
MDTSKNFFVGIENSKTFRRNLLEASKNTVSILRFYQKVLNIRDKKKRKIDQLKRNLDEINSLIAHLDNAMPDMGIRASVHKPKAVRHKHVMDNPPIEEQTFEQKSEIDLLEDQLKDIDSRLNNI